jgi:hypothetical protein
MFSFFVREGLLGWRVKKNSYSLHRPINEMSRDASKNKTRSLSVGISLHEKKVILYKIFFFACHSDYARISWTRQWKYVDYSDVIDAVSRATRTSANPDDPAWNSSAWKPSERRKMMIFFSSDCLNIPKRWSCSHQWGTQELRFLRPFFNVPGKQCVIE